MNERDNKTHFGIIALLAAGHFVNDFYALVLVSLLPRFQDKFELSKFGVAVLPAVMSVFASMTQPLCGYLGDRFNRKIFMACGILCSAIFMSSLGLTDQLPLLIALIIFGGLGVSLFHPNGAANVMEVSGNRRGLAMSIFINSGTLGVASAPVVVTMLVGAYGLHNSYLIVFPGVLMFLALLALAPSSSPIQGAASQRRVKVFAENARALSAVFLIVLLRSLVFMGITSFLMIMAKEIGWSEKKGAFALSLFMFAGPVGGIVGGYLSDAVNKKAIMIVSSFLGFALLYCSLSEDYIRAICFLPLAGAALGLATPVNVVIAQELSPENASTISGVVMGFAWGLAGLFLPFFGKIADVSSTLSALKLLAFTAPIAGLVVFTLPKLETPVSVKREAEGAVVCPANDAG